MVTTATNLCVAQHIQCWKYFCKKRYTQYWKYFSCKKERYCATHDIKNISVKRKHTHSIENISATKKILCNTHNIENISATKKYIAQHWTNPKKGHVMSIQSPYISKMFMSMVYRRTDMREVLHENEPADDSSQKLPTCDFEKKTRMPYNVCCLSCVSFVSCFQVII